MTFPVKEAIRARKSVRSYAGGALDAADRAADSDMVRKDREAEARIAREDKISEARVNASNAVARMNAVQEVTGFGRTTPEDVMPEGESGSFLSL